MACARPDHCAPLRIAGILDAADGVVAYYFAAGFNPIQVLQFIASGFYGAAAFQKGLSGALVGLLAHFFIASRSPPSTWEQPGSVDIVTREGSCDRDYHWMIAVSGGRVSSAGDTLMEASG
jgi:hypothetical protein